MAKLRAEYETVGPGRKLNRKLWNTISLDWSVELGRNR